MPLSLDNATQSWEALTGFLDRFVAAWERGDGPPDLASHLPTEPATLRRLAAGELIKLDLEFRHANGLRKPIEDYVEAFPWLAERGEPPAELIYEEFHVRRTNGDDVSAADYLRRFPHHAVELRRLLAIEGTATLSTGVAQKRVPPLEAGQKLDDFDLLAVAGRGAFGQVFLARQQSLQRLVALKVSTDRGNEPQTLAQLDHAHIVRVFDQRRLDDRQLRLLYMEFVAGGTLQEVVGRVRSVPRQERSGRLLSDSIETQLARHGLATPMESSTRRRLSGWPWPEVVCRLGAQLASALHYAHGRGVLHRDVKPANVLLTSDGRVKLADFNISFSSHVAGATPAAYFGGSLAYMSPEQLEACDPGHERRPDQLGQVSDLYSLAVLLWELLHGERPFADEEVVTGWSETLRQMVARRRAGPPEPAVHEGCEAELVRVLRRAMSPEERDRHTNGEELTRDLCLCLEPRAQRLMHGRRGWLRWAQRWALFLVIGLALVPNAAAGWFNREYNWNEIVRHRSDAAQRAFERLVLIVNGIAFPLGMAVLAWRVWPVTRAIRRDSSRGPPEATFALRRRALWLGRDAALIGAIEWLGGGLAYPWLLQWAAHDVTGGDFVHFLASLAVCGLIAAAYPFFFVSWLALRVLFPRLLRQTPGDERDEAELQRLGRSTGIFLPAAGAVPLLGVALVVLSGARSSFALGVLSVAGLAGFLVAYLIHGQLQRDITALLWTVRPLENADSITTRPVT